MPNVRASSGTIGTIRSPTFGSRSRFRSGRVDATPGCAYGGSSSLSWASVIGSSRRSRNVSSSANVIFFIWWVALRASKSGPSAHPFTVFASTTVGAPG